MPIEKEFHEATVLHTISGQLDNGFHGTVKIYMITTAAAEVAERKYARERRRTKPNNGRYAAQRNAK